jgi:hypothetical protein
MPTPRSRTWLPTPPRPAADRPPRCEAHQTMPPRPDGRGGVVSLCRKTGSTGPTGRRSRRFPVPPGSPRSCGSRQLSRVFVAWRLTWQFPGERRKGGRRARPVAAPPWLDTGTRSAKSAIAMRLIGFFRQEDGPTAVEYAVMLTPPVTPAGRADARPADFLTRGPEPQHCLSQPAVLVRQAADPNPAGTPSGSSSSCPPS